MSTVTTMAQQELATTIAELPNAIKRLRQSQKLPASSRVRLIWDDAEVADEEKKEAIESTGHLHIDQLFADLEKIGSLSSEAQREFDDNRKVFRETFQL